MSVDDVAFSGSSEILVVNVEIRVRFWNGLCLVAWLVVRGIPFLFVGGSI